MTRASTNPISPISLNAVHPHQEYHIPGGDLYFLVGTTSFCIHRYFFIRDSAKFAAELSATTEAGEEPKGSKDRAFKLDDVTEDEFAAFCWVFYNRQYDLYETDVAGWTSILKVAVNHDFPGIKEFATRGLETKKSIALAERIALYMEYKVERQYLAPLFVEMVLREGWLSDEERNQIGERPSTLISRARERFLRLTNGGSKDVTKETAKAALLAIPEAASIVNPSGKTQTAKKEKTASQNGNEHGKKAAQPLADATKTTFKSPLSDSKASSSNGLSSDTWLKLPY